MTTADDDFFEQMSAQLDIDVDSIEAEVVPVTSYSTEILVQMMYALEKELFEMGEALRPTSSLAREKHSLRNSIQVELQVRLGDKFEP